MALSVEAEAFRMSTDEITYLLVYIHDENGNPVVGLQDENFQVSMHYGGFDLLGPDHLWSTSLDWKIPGAYHLSLVTPPFSSPGQVVFLVRVGLTPAVRRGPSSIEAINAAMKSRPDPVTQATEPKLHPLEKPEGFALAPLVWFPKE